MTRDHTHEPAERGHSTTRSRDAHRRGLSRWASRTTGVAADAPASDRDVAVSTPDARDGTELAADVDESGGGPGLRWAADETAWLLAVPFAATVAGALVGAVFGFGVFDTGTPGDVRLLPYVVIVPYFLTALAGTLWLVDDANRLADADADWQPNPWLYVAAGALVVEAGFAVPVLAGDVTTGVVQYLAGALALAGVLSSVVAGPVYLLARRRNLGAP
ncbi:hypothetical protein [Halobacterium yunchengense]|uniref:hypothetical protein n=1 Tax=Halobacterium yunchengense TaxID=3108497 RepID=UPI0030095DFF